MIGIPRIQFAKTVPASLAFSLFLLITCCLPLLVHAQTADAIYHNGTIITIDDNAPLAEAVAVKDGTVIAVGAKNDVLKTKGDATTLVDLRGRTMLPGLVLETV